MNKFLKLLKSVMIAGYVVFVLSLAVTYAASGGQLTMQGIAFVREYDGSSPDLPIMPEMNSDGNYFTFNGLPIPIVVATQYRDDENIILYLRKPQKAPNNGQNHFTVNMSVTNPTNYVWSNGTVTVQATGAWAGNITGSINATTVNSQGRVTITLTVKTKIDVSSVDVANVELSYMMLGNRKYYKYILYIVPWNYVVPEL